MENILRTIPVRKLHWNDRHTERLQQSGQFLDTCSVRSKAAAHKKRIVVKPYHVPGFRRCGATDAAEDRYVPTLERIGERRSFAAPRDFSSLENDRAAVGHEDGIVGVQRIQ